MEKSIADGPPVRLTDSDHHEYAPTFSPDGGTVVYTTWSDNDLGVIHQVLLTGGTPAKLTTRPGHYFTPRYSPDGSRIVYRRGTGNSLRGYLYGTDPGLYWMPPPARHNV